jgi:hypothetical protein
VIWEKTEFQFLSSSRLIRGLPELASQTRPAIFQPEGKLEATGEIGIAITRKYSSAREKFGALHSEEPAARIWHLPAAICRTSY